MQCEDAGPQASKSPRRRDPQKYTYSYQFCLELLNIGSIEIWCFKQKICTSLCQSRLFPSSNLHVQLSPPRSWPDMLSKEVSNWETFQQFQFSSLQTHSLKDCIYIYVCTVTIREDLLPQFIDGLSKAFGRPQLSIQLHGGVSVQSIFIFVLFSPVDFWNPIFLLCYLKATRTRKDFGLRELRPWKV